MSSRKPSLLSSPNIPADIDLEFADIPGKGRGLVFARAYKKGTVVFRYTEGSPTLTEEEFVEFLEKEDHTEDRKRLILSHSYSHVAPKGSNDKSGVVLPEGIAAYCNHDSNPTVEEYCYRTQTARLLRDVEPGDEYCEEYRTYSEKPFDWHERLCEEYGIMSCFTCGHTFSS